MMGVDATIFVHTTDGLPPDIEFAASRPVRFDECDPAGSVGAGRVDAIERSDGVRPTHQVHNGWRYYGPGYERGPWPDIASMILYLLAAENVDVVWYDGDSGWGSVRIDRERLDAINEHWIKNGTRPYYEAFK